jgi:hypothetical protein
LDLHRFNCESERSWKGQNRGFGQFSWVNIFATENLGRTQATQSDPAHVGADRPLLVLHSSMPSMAGSPLAMELHAKKWVCSGENGTLPFRNFYLDQSIAIKLANTLV